jgi:hypothetical protein
LEQQQPDDEVGAIRGFFDDEERAVEEFFTPEIPDRGVTRRPGRRAGKPTHYKVISISLYTEDIDRLNALVDELKGLGHSRASKSMIIREALRQLNLDNVPRQR